MQTRRRVKRAKSTPKSAYEGQGRRNRKCDREDTEGRVNNRHAPDEDVGLTEPRLSVTWISQGFV